MSVDSLAMTLDRGDSVTMWVSRAEGWACLAIRADGMNCEIQMDGIHVRAMRDHLPDVLAGMDRWAAEDAACERAEIAGERAVDAVAKALGHAAAAEAAGAHSVAAALRAAAAAATAKANEVDATVRAFDHATADADSAVDRLIYLTCEAETVIAAR
ncbi:hypothetical protein [Actinokineospora sp.]|uniref:hypothetical protein n=1 Tax=Actinokineospora sp. TaxID=1872133 RepID=UPI004037723D